MLLEKLLRQPIDSPQLHLRDAVYGQSGRAALFQEVLGMANADTQLTRHIFFGVSESDEGLLEHRQLKDSDLQELQSYVDLIKRFVEPELNVQLLVGDIKGQLVAALALSDCTNSPYLLKTDVNRDMRCGACWVREGGLFRPAQRADFDRIYKTSGRGGEVSTQTNVVRLGFGEDPNLAGLRVPLPDISRPPSGLAAYRMQNEIEARQAAKKGNVEDTGLVRLVHARLYGNESPYQDHGLSTLVEGYNSVKDSHSDADDYYYFESNALKLNFSILNTGHQPLKNVSVLLNLPCLDQFRVSDRLYGPPEKPLTLQESELLGYPSVKKYNAVTQVKQELDYLHPDQVVNVFEQALRIAIKPELKGKKMALRYSIHAEGFKEPEEGRLKLIFEK